MGALAPFLIRPAEPCPQMCTNMLSNSTARLPLPKQLCVAPPAPPCWNPNTHRKSRLHRVFAVNVHYFTPPFCTLSIAAQY